MSEARDPGEILRRQEIILGLKGHPPRRHAVPTSEITAIRDRDPEHLHRLKGSRAVGKDRTNGPGLQDIQRNLSVEGRHSLMVPP